MGTVTGVSGVVAASAETNWDRFREEDSHGLLLSLINMKRDQLDVMAEILDAQLLVRKAAPKRVVVKYGVVHSLSKREELFSDRVAPKVDTVGFVPTLSRKAASSCIPSTSQPSLNQGFPTSLSPQDLTGGCHQEFSRIVESPPLNEHYEMEIIAKELKLDQEHPNVHCLFLAIYKSFMEHFVYMCSAYYWTQIDSMGT